MFGAGDHGQDRPPHFVELPGAQYQGRPLLREIGVHEGKRDHDHVERVTNHARPPGPRGSTIHRACPPGPRAIRDRTVRPGGSSRRPR